MNDDRIKTEEHSGSFDDDLGVAIADALAPLRPDPREFAQAVRERVERERPTESRVIPMFARRAALFLPAVLLPKGLVKAGVMIGGATAKGGAWKFLPGVLALPALVFVMLVATFVYGVRDAVVGGRQKDDEEDASKEVKAWWRQHVLAALVTGAIVVFLALEAPVEAVLVFVIVSMLSLVGIFGRLARAGFASRREVGRRTGGFLMALVIYGLMFVQSAPIFAAGQQLVLAVPILLIVGAMTCRLLAGRERADRWPLLGLCLVVFPVVGLLYLVGESPADRDDAVSFVEGGYGDVKKFEWSWDNLGGVIAHLSADGGSLPELEAFREDLEEHIDKGSPINAYGAWPLAELDLFRDRYYGIAAVEDLERLVFHHPQQIRSPDYFGFHVVLLSYHRELTADEVDQLVARLFEGVPEVSRHGILEDLVTRIDLLERLGHPERIPELAALVESSLRATWSGAPDDPVACFAPGQDSIDRDEEGVPDEGRLTPVWLGATDMGVRLMARFGVPEGIDLTALHRYLTAESLQYRWVGAGRTEALAAAIISHLETLPEWKPIVDAREERSVFVRLMDYRLVLATFALIFFCVLVTLRAPRVAEFEEDETA